ncbi:hypothetical protein [Sporosarcina sp. UB5]
MKPTFPLDQSLLEGQTMFQSLFQAGIIIAFLVFIIWVVKLAFD